MPAMRARPSPESRPLFRKSTAERGIPRSLSGGYRVMLEVMADLARRMAQGKTHLDEPLSSEAIV